MFKYSPFLRSISLIFASICLLLSPQVFSENQKADDRWLLAKYDENGDSVISASEIEFKRKRVFSHMDEDGDGDVSYAEYESLDMQKRQPLLQARFNKLDANSDGTLSGDEYTSYLGSFQRFDQNGDGQVSSQEIATKKARHGVPKPEADLCLLWVCVRKSYK